VYDRKAFAAINPKNEFDILKRLQDCPYVVQTIDFYENAQLEVPNNLPQFPDDTLAYMRTGTTLRTDLQCMAMELCLGDFFDLIKTNGPILCRQLLASLFT
jgi:hypothetical protein